MKTRTMNVVRRRALYGNLSRAAQGRFGQGARRQVSCGVSISVNGRVVFEPQPGDDKEA
jgi:hypothetical protein